MEVEADPTVDRMQRLLDAWEVADDGRAVFLDCYLTMTRAVHAELGVGFFDDDAWVRSLLERFADYYFASIDGGPEVIDIPAPWVLAHAAAVGHDAAPIQLLLAGVNAHINYDLVLTLVDVLDEEWRRLGDEDRARRRADYDRINDVIEATADAVQDDVLERRTGWLDLIDRGLGGWDEFLAVRLLTSWRSNVWREAVAMLDLDDPVARETRRDRLSRQCTRRASWLLI